MIIVMLRVKGGEVQASERHHKQPKEVGASYCEGRTEEFQKQMLMKQHLNTLAQKVQA